MEGGSNKASLLIMSSLRLDSELFTFSRSSNEKKNVNRAQAFLFPFLNDNVHEHTFHPGKSHDIFSIFFPQSPAINT